MVDVGIFGGFFVLSICFMFFRFRFRVFVNWIIFFLLGVFGGVFLVFNDDDFFNFDLLMLNLFFLYIWLLSDFWDLNDWFFFNEFFVLFFLFKFGLMLLIFCVVIIEIFVNMKEGGEYFFNLFECFLDCIVFIRVFFKEFLYFWDVFVRLFDNGFNIFVLLLLLFKFRFFVVDFNEFKLFILFIKNNLLLLFKFDFWFLFSLLILL